MQYQTFTVSDFLADAYFQEWVYRPTADNEHFWRDWLQRYPEKAAEVNQARRLLLSVQFKHYAISTKEQEEVWQRINRQRHVPSYSAVYQSRTKRILRWSVAVAASVAVLWLAYVGWIHTRPTVYSAPYATTRTFTLPDQSTVELNANSTLRVSGDWSERREVWLEGEAFFEVRPQLTAGGHRVPFLVHTDELLVRVVGTRFNVLSRHGETQVGLSSGKVKLALTNKGEAEFDMHPGDWIAFSDQQIEKKQRNPAAYTAWRNDQLRFDRNTLAEVRTVLQDHYGYRVTLADSELTERTFSGQFPADRVDLLLAAIRATLGVEIHQTNNEITIAQP